MKKVIVTIAFVVLGIGSIAGAFFYYDSTQKSESLRVHAEKIESLTAKMSDMEAHLENFRKKASEDEGLIEKLQDELETMTSLRSSLKDTEMFNEAVRREINACQDAKASLETLLEDEKSSVRTLGLTLETVRKQVLNSEQSIADKNRSLASLEVTLFKLEAEKVKAKEDADRQIAALEKTVTEGLAKLQAAEDTIRSHRRQIDALNTSIAEMENQLQKALDENQRYQIRLKKSEVDNAAKETQISYLIEEMQRTEDEAARRNAQLKRRIQEKERQIEIERAQVLSLRGQVEEDKNTHAFLEKKFFKLHEQKDRDWIEVSEQIAQLKARMTEQEGIIEDKRRQLSEKDHQLGAVQTVIRSLKTEIDTAGITRENLETELSQLKDAFKTEQRMREANAAELSELRAQQIKEQATVEKRVAYFEDRLSEKETRLAAAQSQIGALKEQVEKDTMVLVALNKRVSELNAQLRTEQLEAAQRNAQLKRLIKDKEIQLEKATVQILNMRASIETAVGARFDMADQISDLKSQSQADINQLLTQLDEKIQTKNQQLKDALSEVEKWRGLYEDLEASLDLKREKVETLEMIVERTRKEKGAVENRLKELGVTYSHLIRELHDNLENKEATIEEYQKRLTVTFVDKILFGRAAVRISEEGKRVLRKTGQVLKNIQYGKIRIVGHTDSDPIRSKYKRIYPSNWELSSARAASVARFFQDDVGIAPEQMEILGLAYTQPIATNETTEGKAKNRRVEIIIIPNR